MQQFVTANTELFAPFAGQDVHGGPPVVLIDGPLLAEGQVPYYLGIFHFFMVRGAPGGGGGGGRGIQAGSVCITGGCAWRPPVGAMHSRSHFPQAALPGPPLLVPRLAARRRLARARPR